MSNNYYVYIYLNPLKNNQPFYVGKGKGKRYLQHLYGYDCLHNPYKMNTINKILEMTGKNPPIEIYRESLSEEDAFFLEKELIASYGRTNNKTGILCNLTDGGEGGSGRIVSEEERQDMSLRFKGKQKSPEHKIKNGLAKKNKIVVKDVDGNQFSVDKDDPRWISGELVGISKNTTLSDSTKELMKQQMIGRKWYNNGTEEAFVFNPPDGYVRGRLTSLMSKINKKRIGLPKSEQFREKQRQLFKNRQKDEKGRLV